MSRSRHCASLHRNPALPKAMDAPVKPCRPGSGGRNAPPARFDRPLPFVANPPALSFTHGKHHLIKPDLGTKRVCPSCAARFYDLQKRPIECPKCAFTFEPEMLLK